MKWIKNDDKANVPYDAHLYWIALNDGEVILAQFDACGELYNDCCGFIGRDNNDGEWYDMKKVAYFAEFVWPKAPNSKTPVYIQWGKSKDGECRSKCGKYRIVPSYWGRTTPVEYRLESKQGSCWKVIGGTYNTQKEVKSIADSLINH